MSDYRTPVDDTLPSLSIQTIQSRQRSASEVMSTDDGAGTRRVTEEAATHDAGLLDNRSHNSTPAPETLISSQVNADPVLVKQVGDVLSSEQGIPTLLHRLKQSIVSAKEFASFLKKRASLEDDHAQSLKKLCRLTQESIRKPDHRQGSFAQIYEEMMQIHERMAENGIQFSATLYQMQEELLELAGSSDRTRKMWKTNGLAAEQKVVDLEQAMRKSKTKYDSLAEEYDRARTGEGKGGSGKVLGAFKAHKSAAQQEEELLKKVQTADQTYHNHVNSLLYEKSQLQANTRPEAVKALREAVAEIDSGVAMQMQKFASYNENLLLGNGLIISPFKNPASLGSYQPRSLRQAVASIDNEKDLNEFIAGSHTRVLPNPGEIKYERNPVLMNPLSGPLSQAQPTHSPQASVSQSGHAASLSMGSRINTATGTGNFGGSASPQPSLNAPLPPPPQQQQQQQQPPPIITQGLTSPSVPSNPGSSLHQQSHSRSFSQGYPSGQAAASPSRGTTPGGSRYGNEAPPQLGNMAFQGQTTPPQQAAVPYQGSPTYAAGSHSPPVLGITKPMFGVHLGRLYERDGLAVPMVVYQCIQAVDLFGLGVEGIYRQSGSMNHISRLKSMFDSEPQGQTLDFRNPEKFFHDVNSVTGLLKQFFRDLPDPLLTMEHHGSFINAAKNEDDIVRRDSLHAIINSLPDPNYATLRALMLHLHRVMDNSHVNRMNSHNLAVILGPTLMGTDPSTAITDAGWQIKVIDTILVNTYQIFDED